MLHDHIRIQGNINNLNSRISSNNASITRLREARAVFVAQQAALRQPRRDYERVRSRQLGNTLLRHIRARGQFQGRCATDWSTEYASVREKIRTRAGVAAEIIGALGSQIAKIDGRISTLEAENKNHAAARDNWQRQLNNSTGG